MPWYWLSFCDDTKPKGQQFQGAVVVEAEDTADAMLKLHKLKISPPGEMLIDELPPGAPRDGAFVNTLLRKDLALLMCEDDSWYIKEPAKK